MYCDICANDTIDELIFDISEEDINNVLVCFICYTEFYF